MNATRYVLEGYVTLPADIAGFLGLFPTPEAEEIKKTKLVEKEANQKKRPSHAKSNRSGNLRTVWKVVGEDGASCHPSKVPSDSMGQK